MRQWPIQILLLSSVWLLTNCSISKYRRLSCTNEQTILKPVLAACIANKYKANIDVLKNHFTGILIVKQTDSLTTRMVFVTELGIKLFDFETTNGTIKTNYIFEALNKPSFVKGLQDNFSNMFLLNTVGQHFEACKKGSLEILKRRQNKNSWFYTLTPKTQQLFLHETFYKRKRNSKIEYSYDNDLSNYTKIKCKQYGLIKFYFELNVIPN